jgi:hypothetical protein
VQRKSNPSMTMFKAMTMDEQVETIELSSQKSLRFREEIKATETIEAQRRGFLLLQGVQRIIDQLQNNLDLVEMLRIPMYDPITSGGESSGLEPIQIEEITAPKNSRVPSPQIRSPGTISTQPEVSRTLGGTGVPNPLFDLITIVHV